MTGRARWLAASEAAIVAMLADANADVPNADVPSADVPSADERRAEVLQFLRERREQLPRPHRAAHAVLTAWFWLVHGALRLVPGSADARHWQRLQRWPGLRRYCAWYRNLCLYAGRARDLVAGAALPPTFAAWPRGERVPALVIGTGPGGAVAAAALARAGIETLAVEEGPPVPPSTPVLSPREIPFYRHGGASFTHGRPRINVVEGCCVGGGSEVNLGIYYRTPPPVLQHWRERLGIDHLEGGRVTEWFERSECLLAVDLAPPADQPAAACLQRGAASLGLPAGTHGLCGGAGGGAGTNAGGGASAGDRPRRRTMASALLAGASGLRLAQARVVRLTPRPGGVAVDLAGPDGVRRVHAERVFVGAGAIQTPHLLRRSYLGRQHGAALRLHTVLKVVAEFADDVHDGTTRVPPVHVHDPRTGTVFGCSVSTPELVALNLAAHPAALLEAQRHPSRWLVFHASVQPAAAGQVARVPGLEQPYVRFSLGGRDRDGLGAAAAQLVRLLLAGGAVRVYLNVPGSTAFAAPGPAAAIPWRLLRGVQWLAAYHLSSSCPMGPHNPVDAAGRLRADPRIVLADASVLPTSPGVNPQGTIMMVAWRNAELALG